MSTNSTAPSVTPDRGRGAVAVLGAALLWGTTGTVSSFAPSGAPALAVGITGLAVGGILLLLTTGSAVRVLLSRDRNRLATTVTGAIAVLAYPASFYPAVASTGVAVATVVALGSSPVFTGVFGRLLNGEHLTLRWSMATVSAIVGCAALVLGAGTDARLSPAGVGLALVAGGAYAAYTVLGARLVVSGASARGAVGSMFGAAALVALPLAALMRPVWLGTVSGALVIAHLAVVTTFLAYLCYGYGLRSVPAAVVATLSLFEPAVATVLGVTVVGERLPLLSWCGLAVLATGILALAVARRR
ncbi:MAG: EamA family transporter, partial [Kutzneria sp.]|nr:EamA family transporter [Kutzneria sp.]